MKIAIVGATGFVGKAVVAEALNRGHKVTALSRHPENLETKNADLVKSAVDIADQDRLVGLLKGHDAVLCAYNPGWTDPEIYEHTLEGSSAIEKAVEKAGVKRFLMVGGAGSLEISPGVQLVDTKDFPAEYKSAALGLRDYLNRLKKNQVLDWTFLSPAILMHAGVTTGRTGKYRVGSDQPLFDDKGVSTISAEDLAVALLDELEKGRFIRKRFTVGY